MTADLPPRLARTIEYIRTDRAHGAYYLTRAAITALWRATREPGDDPAATLRMVHSAARELAAVRPSMASLANSVATIWLAGGREPAKYPALRVRAMYEEASRLNHATFSGWADMLVPHARPLLRGVVFTHSRSGTVELTLKRLLAEGTLSGVVVTESHPGGEGVALARELAASGAKVTLVADAACGFFVRDASAVVVGADSIRSNGGVVNKVGTYPLALAARAAGVPVYVLADSTKIAPARMPLVFEEMAGNELLPEPMAGITVRNPYFEHVPADVVTAIVTEDGTLNREAIQERAGRADEALTALLAES